MGVRDRLAHAYNAFLDQGDPMQTEPTRLAGYGNGGYSTRPDRQRLRVTNERSIIASIYNRIAIDFASIDIRHVRLDDQGRYREDIKSALNNCLTVEANIDQAARHFRQDLIMSLFDEGHIAIVPVDLSANPNETGSYEIYTLRVGRIVQYFPEHVRVSVYNEKTGRREELTLMKNKEVAIVENPLYSVMNEPNSTLQRLLKKLHLLDLVDDRASSGKLDMVVQLPYTVRNETRKKQAEQRRADVEYQLKDSQYGIAYLDANEKITQLNRPVENNLLKQVESYITLLYSQLGITAGVMDGTASEAEMLNYVNRTIEPLLGAVSEAMKRSFLTRTARTQGQSIEYFRDPFKLVPMSELAELADKFTRNEIVTSNEFRGFIGMKPVDDPKADQLRNSNMPQSELGIESPQVVPGEVVDNQPVEDDPEAVLNASYDEMDKALDEVFTKLGVEE